MHASRSQGPLRTVASKTPVPLAGLMLGLSSTGNMVPEYRWFFGLFAFVILAILVVKFTMDTKSLREDFKNPAIAGIACTMTMATSVLSTYLKLFSNEAAIGMWVASMVVHLGFMLHFTRSFIVRFDLKKCLPCYFVVYVGFAVNAFIAPVYGYMMFGQALFWFGLASLVLLLPPLLYRAMVVKGIPEALVPTLMIFAAPTNVCLNAYLKAFEHPEPLMVWSLLGLAIVLYAGCLAYLPRILLLKKFLPAYSSLTFPLAISGIATGAAYQYFLEAGSDLVILHQLAWFQTALCVTFVLYVLVRYIHHYLWKPWSAARIQGPLPAMERNELMPHGAAGPRKGQDAPPLK